MTMTALDRVSMEASKLPEKSRLRLAAWLIEGAGEISEKESERLWLIEIKKRYKENLEGRMKFKPLDKVMKSLEKRPGLALRHA